MRCSLSLAGLLLVLRIVPAFGQSKPDTSHVRELDSVVVTAARSPVHLATSAAAVSVLTRQELRQLPHRTLADALQTLPGFGILAFDGLGLDPQLTVRGFYGGGEAEYVVVLLDGQPLNEVEGGLVNWDLLPISAIERIEVVRGGASALYGDAAVGAVVNVITRSGTGEGLAWRLAGGEAGVREASARYEDGGKRVSVFGDLRASGGVRDHDARSAGTLRASAAVLRRHPDALRISALTHWRTVEEPGPLTGDLLGSSRTASAPFYRFDGARERQHRLGVNGRRDLGSASALTGYLLTEVRRSETTRTLPLAADYADTKDRDLDGRRILGSLQFESAGLALPGEERIVSGLDVSLGTVDSRYFDRATGNAEAYRTARGRGDLAAAGDARRGSIAAFASYELQLLPTLRVSLGTRLDRIADRYRPDTGGTGSALEAEHTAWSPKIGANFRYVRQAAHEGHVYASWGRFFKAPTLDQLFDPRPIPVPFEPYQISFSSALLRPQRGAGIEAGVYHAAVLGAVRASLSLAAYRMDMEDEIDFDLQQFRYVNIGRSRHDGVEVGLELVLPGGVGAVVNYTLQDVTLRRGDFEGNQVKAVPRHVLNGSVTVGRFSGLHAGLVATHTQGIYLDDANTLGLSGFTRLDGRIAHPLGPVQLTLDVFNLLDRTYSTTGYPDPAGSGTVYYYPAAGRTLRIGVGSR